MADHTIETAEQVVEWLRASAEQRESDQVRSSAASVGSET
jgi:hypothetical protein